MLHAFAFRLFFPKRKALADIHRNVGLIRLVMRSSNCSKPVIIWTLGHLGPGHTTAKTMTTVTVTFTATAKNAVNRSHTQNFLSSHWCPICCELPFHCIFQACSAPQRRTRLGEWSLRPLFSSLLSQWILSPERQLLPFSVRIPRCSRFLVLGRHHSLLHLRRSQDTYDYRCRGSHCHIDVHVTSKPCSRSRYETCSVTDKTSPSPSFLP